MDQKRKRGKAKRPRARPPASAVTAVEPSAAESDTRPEATFVDDPRPARATPDSLDDAAATSVEAGVEGVRNDNQQ